MFYRSKRLIASTLVLGGAIGCANVKVSKVNVQDRLNGQDEKVEGFRYYLNRPYVVVSKQVPVTTSYLPVSLAMADDVLPGKEGKDNERLFLISQVRDPSTRMFTAYDLRGTPLQKTPTKFEVLRVKAVPATGNKIDSKAVIAKVITQVMDIFTMDPRVVAKKITAIQNMAISEEIRTKAGADGRAEDLSDPSKFSTALQGTANAAITVANDQLLKILMVEKAEPLMINAQADIVGKIKMSDFQSKSETAPKTPSAAALVTTKPTPKLAPTTGDKPADKPAGDTPGAVTPSSVQVVYLTDFEEQYAIKNCNMLAKTKYHYKFSNGSELSSITGSYNSTDVPIKVLETFGKLIDAIGSIAQTRINPAGAAAGTASFLDRSAAPPADFYLKIEQFIEPGMYRVQKSWERAAADLTSDITLDQATAMFSDLGLSVISSTSVIDKSQYDADHKTQP